MWHFVAKTISALGLTLVLLVGCRAMPTIDRTPEGATGLIPRKLVRAESYMLATANPYASKAGYRILQRGGSAIDAAVAVSMVLTLVEPQSSGLGGGSFMLYWDQQTQKLQTYDGRETAPQNVGPDLFFSEGKPLGFQQAVAGGRAVGVPGLLKSLELAHRKYGRLPWRELFSAAIRLAETGFRVSPRLNRLLGGRSRNKLLRNSVARDYFYPDDQPPVVGHLLKNPRLAESLRQIATRGSAAFYSGAIARHMVQTVQQDRNPGQLSLHDLTRYLALERTPVCSSFYAYRVCGMGPPSSGGISVLQMLTLLEAAAIDKQQAGSLRAIHLFSQAGRLAFADRALYIADPAYADVPTQGLLDPAYLKKRARLIDPVRDTGKAVAGSPPGTKSHPLQTGYNPEQPGTSHISIVDSYGNALALTASIEQGFGSGLMVDGFLLNNELTDFSFAWQNQDGRAIANRVAGGKRPRSSMAPTMVFDQNTKLKLVIGSPGGSRIIPYVTQTIVNSLVWQQNIQTAINQPHYLHRNGAELDLEKGRGLDKLKPSLEKLGYRVSIRDLNSGLHGIVVNGQNLEGAADPRREGLVIGE